MSAQVAARLALLLGVVAQLGCGTKNELQGLDQGSLAAPQTVTIKIKNYRPQAGAGFQHLFVSNYSVKAVRGQLLYSQARDGMTDVVKTQAFPDYGFALATPETVVTGFSDSLLYTLGIKTPQQSLIHCAGGQLSSTTGDGFDYADERLPGAPQTFLGLRDCEKTYLNLNPSKFDNAGNGIPDSVKMRCGLNPLSFADAYLSTAGDGVANIDKCKQNIPIDENAFTQANQAYAYHYETQINQDGSTDFTISNIPVLNGGTDNFVAFFITEQNLGTQAPAMYTAFTVLRPGLVNGIAEITYWATAPANFTNQRVTIP